MKTMIKTAAFLAMMALPAIAHAQSQPPVQGPQDQACRDEARTKVMGGQVPAGMDMRTAGEGFYNDCMRRSASKGGASKASSGKGKATKAKKSKRKS